MRNVMKKIVLTMAALALLEDLANGAIRRERLFRERDDLLVNDDNWLISRFRFPRPVLLELCAELRLALERNTARSQGLSVPTQVLTTLGFLATGIPAGAGRPVRSVPVNPEPSHASCVGRNHPNVIQVHQIPIQCC